MASAIARSAAGSSARAPPATLTKTSASPRRTPGVAREHGDHLGQARAVDADGDAPRRHDLGRAHQGLHLDQHRAGALDRREDARARRARRPRPGRGGSGRSTDTSPAGRISNSAGLVGRAEAVLGGAQHAVRAQVVALEGEHAVDEVLQRPRAGEAAVLGHLADQQDRDAALLGGAHQLDGDVAHLVRRARRRPRGRPSGASAPSRSRRRPARAPRWPRAPTRAGSRPAPAPARSRTRGARRARAPGSATPRRSRASRARPTRAAGSPAPGAPACSCRCRAPRRSAPASPGPGRRPARGRARRCPSSCGRAAPSTRSASRVTSGARRRARRPADRRAPPPRRPSPTHRRPGSARPSVGPAVRRPHTYTPLGRATAPRRDPRSDHDSLGPAGDSSGVPPAVAPTASGSGSASWMIELHLVAVPVDVTVLPSGKPPDRSLSESGSSIRRWIARRSGRAPIVGS